MTLGLEATGPGPRLGPGRPIPILSYSGGIGSHSATRPGTQTRTGRRASQTGAHVSRVGPSARPGRTSHSPQQQPRSPFVTARR